jgi:hypothetical protein
MNARIQTWMPFTIQICLNGREWLARQMDAAGIRYRRRDNCFTWIEDSVALAEIYPALVQHGISAFSSPDVMRFLGRKVHGAFRGEIVSDFKDRPEGVRIKHRVGINSVKLYDKQGSILRVETTVNDPRGFKVFRPAEGDPEGHCTWRPMRKGIADLHRRARVSAASNERYLDALASVDTSTPLGELIGEICRPALWRGKRVRALRPWSEEDVQLFEAVTRGEFNVNGFRNRDLQALLYNRPAGSPEEKRRRSSRVTRLLRMLRAHGLIRKVPHTRRYTLAAKGRQVLPAILTADNITLGQIQRAVS